MKVAIREEGICCMVWLVCIYTIALFSKKLGKTLLKWVSTVDNWVLLFLKLGAEEDTWCCQAGAHTLCLAVLWALPAWKSLGMRARECLGETECPSLPGWSFWGWAVPWGTEEGLVGMPWGKWTGEQISHVLCCAALVCDSKALSPCFTS